MGTWSHEPFANDDAADWLTDLLEQDELKPIVDAFCAVTRPEADPDDDDEYIEIPEGAIAIAAAQAFCVMTDLETDLNAASEEARQTHQDIRKWAEQFSGRKLGTKWFSTALEALVQIKRAEVSELFEVWQESDAFQSWQSSVDGLISYYKYRLDPQPGKSGSAAAG
jgi:Domain of unknown function (DUF4259)